MRVGGWVGRGWPAPPPPSSPPPPGVLKQYPDPCCTAVLCVDVLRVTHSRNISGPLLEGARGHRIPEGEGRGQGGTQGSPTTFPRVQTLCVGKCTPVSKIEDRWPGWVWAALHGHFVFATGYVLRDRVDIGGKASNQACNTWATTQERSTKTKNPLSRCVCIETTSTSAAWRSSHLVCDLGRREQIHPEAI